MTRAYIHCATVTEDNQEEDKNEDKDEDKDNDEDHVVLKSHTMDEVRRPQFP